MLHKLLLLSSLTSLFFWRESQGAKLHYACWGRRQSSRWKQIRFIYRGSISSLLRYHPPPVCRVQSCIDGTISDCLGCNALGTTQGSLSLTSACEQREQVKCEDKRCLYCKALSGWQYVATSQSDWESCLSWQYLQTYPQHPYTTLNHLYEKPHLVQVWRVTFVSSKYGLNTVFMPFCMRTVLSGNSSRTMMAHLLNWTRNLRANAGELQAASKSFSFTSVY